MKKNKTLLLTLASLLLVGCAPSNSSTNTTEPSDQTSSQDSSTSEIEDSSTSEEEVIDEEITLKTFGDIYLNSFRSIYATLKNNTKDNIMWKSSNPQVVSVMSREDINGEAFLGGEGVGTAVITCYLEKHPSIKKEITITVKEGEAMPLDLYNKLIGSTKVLTDDYVYTYDLNTHEPTLDEHYKLETTFEEYAEFDNDEFNTTDAYEFKSVNTKNDKVDYNYKYVRGPKNLVTREELSLENTIAYAPVVNKEGEAMPWATSLYYNMLGNPNVSNNELFRTFDGGKTYHFVGIETQSNIIVASLYMLDFRADDLYFTIDGDNVTLTAYAEPFRSSSNQNFRSGRTFVSNFTELGTAEITHVYPFDTMPYHKQIRKAIHAISDNGNYTAEWTLKFKKGLEASIKHKFKFTNTDLYEESYRDGVCEARVGSHKTENDSWYEYRLDVGIGYQDVIITKEYKKGWYTNLENTLPGFGFAPEIFEPVEGQPNVYQTIGNQGALVMRAALLSVDFAFYNFPGKAYLTLDEKGNLAQIKTDVTDKDGRKEMEVIIDYSYIGTTSVNYDFKNAKHESDPTTWEEENANLYKELCDWNLEDIIPFMHAQNGYNGWVGNQLDDKHNIKFAFITSENFDSEKERDEFITAYQELLVSEGWVDTGTEDDHTGYRLYKKGAYQIGVGIRYNVTHTSSNPTDSIKIIVLSNLLVKPDDIL